MTLVELTDADLAAMLAGSGDVRSGIRQAPGGVDDLEVVRHVRRMATRLQSDGYAGGHWMMVADGEALGLCGIKAPPSRDGEVEIGYGVAASRRRRGHATAAIAAVIVALRDDTRIASIIALTVPDNVASQRVLSANGFVRDGTEIDPHDGEVIRWRLPVREAALVEPA